MSNQAHPTANRLRGSALWLYRLATSRYRTRAAEKLRDEGNCPVAILFYHRVIDEPENELSISTSNFAAHLDWLRARFDIVSLEEAQTRIRANYNDRPTVSITFDDGYGCNSVTAIPELIRRNLTATYFVATDFVESGYPFPHDAKYGATLKPNTVKELQEMVDVGITLGAHTRTHCNLGTVTCPEVMRSEIIGSAKKIEEWCQSRIKYFAFPFGMPANTNQLAVDVIHEAGFAGFCTAYGAWNWPNSDGYHLRRIHGDTGLERLKNWLTLDSRKLRDNRTLPFVVPCSPPAPLVSY
jgi:peptidoglycan/xylan/chitin deacetylase (PgdA/CDA1 family)